MNNKEIIEDEIQDLTVDLELNIYPIKSHGVPAIEISCMIQDKDRIQELIKKALEDEDLIARIVLRKKWKAIPRLAKLGLINPEII